MLKKLFFPVCALAVLAGCAGVDQTGFLKDYQKLRNGDYLEKVYFSEPFAMPQAAAVLIRAPGTSRLKPSAGLQPETVAQNFGAVLQEWLERIANLKVVSQTDQKYDYELVTEITDLKAGSRAMRWFAGELGAGHTKVQVEGYLIDRKSKEILFEFADRRAGSAHGGLDITGGDSHDLLVSDLDNIAKSLAQTMQKAMG